MKRMERLNEWERLWKIKMGKKIFAIVFVNSNMLHLYIYFHNQICLLERDVYKTPYHY